MNAIDQDVGMTTGKREAELEAATIYALKGDPDWCDSLYTSLRTGEGRFGWSYVETANLQQLKQRIETHGWGSLSEDEKDCYQNFLLDIRVGDYVVYINVPEWGKCTLAKVTGPYEWRFEDEDFNHRFPVDPASVHVFGRNDTIVHPNLRTRLKLQGRKWRINLKTEFEALLRSLNDGVQLTQSTPDHSLRLLSNEIQPFLEDMTKSIHHTHPNSSLEAPVAEVFWHVPQVTDVHCQGGAGDHGADILVRFETGLEIPGLEDEGLLVVQVKSYEGEHWDTQAVEDIQRAFAFYPDATMGLIVSTASASTPALDAALDELKEESGKPVALLIGPDVAAFLMRYGAKLLA